MKLYLVGHDYKYAVEQMMLTLLPCERPEYPREKPLEGENWAKVTLSRGKTWVTAVAEVSTNGERCRRLCRTKAAELTDKMTADRALQYIVKQAFYRAAIELLQGGEPPWGSLTGVRPVKIPTRAMEKGATPAEAERILRDHYGVSASRRQLAMDCARASLGVKAGLKPREVSIYVGIPFCPSRCTYCSFISAAVGRALKLVEPYLKALFLELDATGDAVRRAGHAVKSVYIGGGTPTTLSAEQLAALMKKIHAVFDLSRCVEFTVEAGRPDTITREKLAVIAANGGDRVSVNPQSMDDEVLRAIGRAHTAAETLAAFELVRASGISCVNMDLIAGLPKDTFEGFCHSLDQVLTLSPENITVHTLALKKGSRLMDEGGHLPNSKAVAAMLNHAHSALSEAGYRPYYLYRQKFMAGAFENVGWCKPGFESIYNICMMEELHTIISLGAGGVTKLINTANGRIVRMANPKYPQEYINNTEKMIAGKERILLF